MFVLLLSLAATAQAALYDTVIKTKYGLVQGAPALNSTFGSNLPGWENITAWKGIPYASPPTGENRWRIPRDPEPWDGILNATSFGDACAFADAVEDFPQSEDCLTVNIWTSAESTDEKRPVMVWSYGATTAARMSWYDGGGMASKGVVYVSYNYRTGPFGWLSLPELSDEMEPFSGVKSSGNWGLLDQIQILKWVQENIEAFGGDPNQVVHAGESFGSAASYHTLNSPLAKGLMHGVIAESGIKDPYDPATATFANAYYNLSYAYDFSQIYMDSLNVSSVAELRNLTTDELMTGTGVDAFYGFAPVMDYWAIPSTYEGSVRWGPQNDVPLIVGNNHDEDGVQLGLNLTESTYINETETTYGADAAATFLASFPAQNASSAGDAYNAMQRAIYTTSTWEYCDKFTSSAQSPVYYYFWTHSPPGQTEGAYHGSEVFYVLNTLYGGELPYTAEDYAIADYVSSYWANFVKTLNPNIGGSYTNGSLTFWPAYSSTENVQFEIGDAYGNVEVADQDVMDAVDEYFHWAMPDPW
ncbi:hypothetical protein ASPZODRAFT_155521 [Penicilliopsis zonata CBS 506.65]|uniref:Carboxylesterase type B domain-containing protein n=1 Tax=Penicilliopsis zonata CBS 506.65 TaxID=1073090 RepID=A0A1L9S4I7_9EURO|nr:hypothetical protein ASPZODRAFT_155521 [Penicilliopsis zonata CBS 506.65]OJJ42072.1 hypothetical protein ASPZODRAFT_155521 [Penicilliopsis zonata CBS 506.65]